MGPWLALPAAARASAAASSSGRAPRALLANMATFAQPGTERWPHGTDQNSHKVERDGERLDGPPPALRRGRLPAFHNALVSVSPHHPSSAMRGLTDSGQQALKQHRCWTSLWRIRGARHERTEPQPPWQLGAGGRRATDGGRQIAILTTPRRSELGMCGLPSSVHHGCIKLCSAPLLAAAARPPAGALRGPPQVLVRRVPWLTRPAARPKAAGKGRPRLLWRDPAQLYSAEPRMGLLLSHLRTCPDIPATRHRLLAARQGPRCTPTPTRPPLSL